MEMTAKEIERFMKKVAVPADDSGCWLWTAATDFHGYGKFSLERRGGTQRKIGAHRFSYELYVGPIPEGLELDHLCHTADLSCPGNECVHRLCVSPAHLEPVTHAVNLRRGRAPSASGMTATHCKQNHLMDDANTYIRTDGARRCRACARQQDRQRART